MLGLRHRLIETRKRRAMIEDRFDEADARVRSSAKRATDAARSADSAVSRAAAQLLSDHEGLVSGRH